MAPLELVQLPVLMAFTSGSADIVIALLDGPVVLDHPDLLSERIHDIPGGVCGGRSQASSSACQHETFVVGILSARSGGTVGSSAITRHPWVIPVVGYGLNRRPMIQSRTLAGTSFAIAFVTGAIALLWSMFPAVTAIEVTQAITHNFLRRRTGVVPPLLNAWAAYSVLSRNQSRKVTA